MQPGLDRWKTWIAGSPRFTDAEEPAVHGKQRRIGYVEAVREAFDEALGRDPHVYLMGQGVDDPYAMFGTTRGLPEKYGAMRVFDTPLSENALTGVALGSALTGMRPIYCHNRPDFLWLAMDQIVNHGAFWNSMFGGAGHGAPLVIWTAIGRGWGAAAQHSQSLQAIFMHVPGLKLVMPSTPFDAKGLLLSAIADNNPVIVLEHRSLLKQEGPVPEGFYSIPLGKGVIRRKGRDITIAGVSCMIREALKAAEQLAECGIEVEVVDLRTLKPLDEELLVDSVRRTGRLLVVDTGWRTCGIAAELAAIAGEKAFAFLKAPVRRLTAPDCPVPAGYSLEQAYYTDAKDIHETVMEMIGAS